MTTRYFFSADGQTYLGGFSGESALALVPSDAIEVDAAPSHGRDTLNIETGEIIPYVEPKPLDQQMDELLDTLPLEVQNQFAPLLPAGKLFIENNRMDRLTALITSVVVPPELDSVKTQMLNLIPQEGI